MNGHPEIVWCESCVYSQSLNGHEKKATIFEVTSVQGELPLQHRSSTALDVSPKRASSITRIISSVLGGPFLAGLVNRYRLRVAPNRDPTIKRCVHTLPSGGSSAKAACQSLQRVGCHIGSKTMYQNGALAILKQRLKTCVTPSFPILIATPRSSPTA